MSFLILKFYRFFVLRYDLKYDIKKYYFVNYLIVLLIYGELTTLLLAKECCNDSDVLVEQNETQCFNKLSGETYNVNINSTCDFIIVITREKLDDFKEQDEGLLYWRYIDEGKKFPTATSFFHKSEYCMGSLLDENDTITESAAICAEIIESPYDGIAPYCLLVSAIFLLLTTMVYGSIKKLRDLQGKSIIGLCGSFSISLMMIGSINLQNHDDMIFCTIQGFVSYFFTMASFFWMNSISIQVLLSTRKRNLTPDGWREFIYYAVYSWGCATVLTLCAAVANYVPAGQIAPGFGYGMTCWFTSMSEQWLYMYSVLTVLVVINCAIYIYTMIFFCRNTFHSSRVKALRYKFCLNLRLFVIMGVAWIFEIASTLHEESYNHIVWFIIDLFNALQGLFIFIILVVFRRKAIKAIYKRGWFFCLSNFVEKQLGNVEDDEVEGVHHAMEQTEDNRNTT